MGGVSVLRTQARRHQERIQLNSHLEGGCRVWDGSMHHGQPRIKYRNGWVDVRRLFAATLTPGVSIGAVEPGCDTKGCLNHFSVSMGLDELDSRFCGSCGKLVRTNDLSMPYVCSECRRLRRSVPFSQRRKRGGPDLSKPPILPPKTAGQRGVLEES